MEENIVNSDHQVSATDDIYPSIENYRFQINGLVKRPSLNSLHDTDTIHSNTTFSSVLLDGAALNDLKDQNVPNVVSFDSYRLSDTT